MGLSARESMEEKRWRGDDAPHHKTAPFLFKCDRCDRTAVNRLLTVAGVTAIGIGDPRLVISQFENLGAKLGAKSTTDAGVQINFGCCHYTHSFLGDAVVGIGGISDLSLIVNYKGKC